MKRWGPLAVLFLLLYAPVHSQIVLEQFVLSECNDCCDLDRLQPRIAYQDIQGDRLKLAIDVVLNCANNNSVYEFKGDTLQLTLNGEEVIETATMDEHGVEITEETIIDVVAFCDCYFNLEYVFTGIKKIPQVVTVNGQEIKYYQDRYKTYPVRFQIVAEDTINYSDKYGLAQGYWEKNGVKGNRIDGEWQHWSRTINYRSGRPFREEHFEINQPFSAKYYHENGKTMAIITESEGENYWDCYDPQGNEVTKAYLEEKGLLRLNQ